jgi:phospholipase A-2-activating protein
VITPHEERVIKIFPLGADAKDEPRSLIGHTNVVCTLHVGSNGVIISGSWDGTAKIWKNFECAYDLIGHTASVWAVLALDDDQYLTGSADKTIKLWKEHKCVLTFTGHTDAVRGLALMPDIGFASCSNDGVIRVWTLAGDVIYTLSDHKLDPKSESGQKAFIYSLSILPSGGIVSGGEDYAVSVWRDGELSQKIVHPAISVWTVASMPNGDIVSGCNDGIVRVFSESEDRWASAADLKAYDDQVASQALPSQTIGDVKKTDLPGSESLTEPGKKPAEVKMIRNGDIVEAYQWDSASSSWTKIGEVVDAVGSSHKQLYEGKEYDYVFDVDIKDGVPPLKLPYNVNENPYGAAQRFLERNELPTTYVDQVVQFIEKNTGGVNLGSGNNNEYADPFTGASRYQSSANSASTGPASSYMDPYTGASRYSGAEQSAVALPSAPPFQPVTNFVPFKQANVPAMQAKLFQFNDDLRNEISTSSLAMYPDEVNLIDEAFTYLTHALAVPPIPQTVALSVNHFEAIIQILDRWPLSQRFPVIDLSRLMICFRAGVSSNPGIRERLFQCLFKASEWDATWSLPLSKTKQTNILLLLRTIANAFQEGAPIDEGTWVNQVFEALGDGPYEAFNKSQRVAIATILFNFSCANARTPVASSVRSLYLTILTGVLRAETTDSEAAYRALVALGNTVHTAKAQNLPLDRTQSTEVRQVASIVPTTFPEDRVKNVSGGIIALL